MRLTKYDLTITIANPDEPETKFKLSVKGCKREELLKVKLIGAMVEDFEDYVVEKEGK